MGILEDIEAKKADAQAPKKCKYALLLDTLTLDEQEALLYVHQAIQDDNPAFSFPWLVKILNDNGHPIGRTVVREHVRGECSCE